ncbi:MAG: hypothetical protein BAJALOKI3v1_540002 [Promethearchaeota archaeon]|nr:MAG: hypothetical protein BAJALOKI3v1_540002 [Candidatus Lokiarchaeota archaeon]
MNENNTIKYEELKSLFYPEHIAFVGASENSAFGAMLYLPDFRDSRWSDTFYPINPKYEEILGWKCYSSVLDVPYPIDTAYISLKTEIIPMVLKECVEKKIKWVIIFASGFSETGEEKGKKLENQLLNIIKDSKTRIIGPNCLGPYNGTTGMAFSFASSPKAGSISFMSQSGGHLSQLLDIGEKRDMRFRFGVSFGNQIDVNCVDFLRFFRQDPKTKVIAAYLESFGSAEGYEFFKELKRTADKKPIIIWKGGYTSMGAHAAFSHTGALATKYEMWETMSKQTGAILVHDNEEFWNVLKTFELIEEGILPKGRNVAIITPGGGSSVNMTDLFISHNLKVPILSETTQRELGRILPKENVIIHNPIDMGAAGFIIDVYIKCITIILDDPIIDIVVLPLWPHHIFRYVFKRMVNLQKKTEKPLVFCLPSLADSMELVKKFAKAKKILHGQRALYYFSLKEAANSLNLLCSFAKFCNVKKRF